MNTTVEQVVQALLYEGYNLYPYRPSIKSQRRWMFGVVYPRQYSEAGGGTEPWNMQTECLVECGPACQLDIEVRFLHLISRSVSRRHDPATGHNGSQTWQEASERSVCCKPMTPAELLDGPQEIHFGFPAWRQVQLNPGQESGGTFCEQQAISGTVDCSALRIADDLIRLQVRIANTTPVSPGEPLDAREAPLHAFVSTHTILQVRDGRFVSLIDPPDKLRGAVEQLTNERTWPVLVGDEALHNQMLSSPIILYDFPEVAGESPGDLFDSTEIDEILALRVMTLSDEEKRQIRGGDERTRELLARTETLPQDQLMKLHGAIRGLKRVAAAEN